MPITPPPIGEPNWGPDLNADLVQLDTNTTAETAARTTADTTEASNRSFADSTESSARAAGDSTEATARASAVAAEALRATLAEADLQSQLNRAIPGNWVLNDTYVTGTHRVFGGQEWVAATNVPTGIAPNPIGDGSTADRNILLAGRVGYARGTLGGHNYPTLYVNTSAATGTGSFHQACLDSQSAGGGYIIWIAGTYTHSYAPGTPEFIPSNTTVNAWGANVTFTGFGQDDNTSFNIGGLDNTSFAGFYGSVPAHDIIVTGIKFNCNNGVADSHGDVMSVRFWSRNIWIDHCFFTNPQKLTDGLLDITHCDSATVSWCDIYQHHKAVLTHSKPLVNSPSGTQLPPGVTAGSPGAYTIQNVGGTDYIQNRVTYAYNLYDSLAQRSPESDFDTTYVDVASCWVRLFGGYNDGVNTTVNGLYNWPTTSGARWSEVTLPGPSTGPGAPNSTVVGAFKRNSGSGSKSNGTSLSVTGSHMLVRGTTYTNLSGDTNPAIGSNGGNFRTDTNVYESAPTTADVHPERVGTPGYPMTLLDPSVIKNALRYGTARNNASTYWTYVGPSTLGTVGTVVQQGGVAVGAAKILNYTGTAWGTLTFDSGTGTVTVPAAAGATDPSLFLLFGPVGSRAAAGVGNKGYFYYANDTGRETLYQCQGTGPYSWVPLLTKVVPGQVIGSTYYHPTSQNATNISHLGAGGDVLTDLATYATTATWSSNSATMFDVPFVAPSSGAVTIRASWHQSASGSCTVNAGLWDVDAAAVVTNSEETVTNTSADTRPQYEPKITGLTPGQTYHYRLQIRVLTAQTLTIYSGGTKGAVRIEALAA